MPRKSRWRWFANAIQAPIHQLLSPSGNSCLACGKLIIQSQKAYPEICLSCYDSIPWIQRPRCYTCGRYVGCPDCSRQGKMARYFLINRSAVAYNSQMREWLAQYKFRGHEAYSSLLARMMGVAMRSMLYELGRRIQERHFYFDAVIPVPISEERMMERGFNQARTLAYGAASVSKTKVLEMLCRPRHTEKQSFMNRRDRLQNLRGVYQPVADAPERLISVLQQKPKTRLLLIDDVYTTGSTMNTCAGMIHQVCDSLGIESEVYSLTWARS